MQCHRRSSGYSRHNNSNAKLPQRCLNARRPGYFCGRSSDQGTLRAIRYVSIAEGSGYSAAFLLFPHLAIAAVSIARRLWVLLRPYQPVHRRIYLFITSQSPEGSGYFCGQGQRGNGTSLRKESQSPEGSGYFCGLLLSLRRPNISLCLNRPKALGTSAAGLMTEGRE